MRLSKTRNVCIEKGVARSLPREHALRNRLGFWDTDPHRLKEFCFLHWNFLGNVQICSFIKRRPGHRFSCGFQPKPGWVCSLFSSEFRLKSILCLEGHTFECCTHVIFELFQFYPKLRWEQRCSGHCAVWWQSRSLVLIHPYLFKRPHILHKRRKK